MAKVIGDVMYPGGKYIKDGEEKTRWIKCGALFETNNGQALKLDMIPLGIPEGGAWFQIFDNTDKPASGGAPKKSSSGGKDDIPF